MYNERFVFICKITLFSSCPSHNLQELIQLLLESRLEFDLMTLIEKLIKLQDEVLQGNSKIFFYQFYN